MKKYISKLILSIISLPLISFGQQLNLDNSLTISSGSDGFGRPRIALTDNGPIIIWRKDSTDTDSSSGSHGNTRMARWCYGRERHWCYRAHDLLKRFRKTF